MRIKMKFRRMLAITVSTMLICSMLSGCMKKEEASMETADTQTAEETRLFSEGVDTSIEVTGYHKFTGADASCFLKAGDKVAVISPSSLPTRAQADATINGLKEWGYVPVEGKYVCTADRTLDNCREDLEWALSDPEIKAVFYVRGGYASCEVMAAMNRKLYRRFPRRTVPGRL